MQKQQILDILNAALKTGGDYSELYFEDTNSKSIVLENGNIADIGTHAELSSKDGLYASLWKIQGALEEEFLNLVEKEVK